MVNIPKTYRSKTLHLDVGEIEPLIIEIRGYRPADIDLASEIQEIRNELPRTVQKLELVKDIVKKVQLKAKKANKNMTELEAQKMAIEEFNKMDVDKLSDDEVKQVMDARNEVDKVNAKLSLACSELAQRGLKRFFYKDEKDFKEAEITNTLTDHIDSLPDIDMDIDNQRTVAFTMLDLSKPSEDLQTKLENKQKEDLKEAGKGKPGKKGRGKR